jgi:hypothetical protein
MFKPGDDALSMDQEARKMAERNGLTERRRVGDNSGVLKTVLDFVLKTWPLWLFIIGWVVRVEKFILEGERFTTTDYVLEERELARELDDKYVSREVIEARLDNIETILLDIKDAQEAHLVRPHN